MLDLVYNPPARTLSGTLQLKSTGGIFISTTCGRQSDHAGIGQTAGFVPLKGNKDAWPCRSGEKFESALRTTLVVFSTTFTQ